MSYYILHEVLQQQPTDEELAFTQSRPKFVNAIGVDRETPKIQKDMQKKFIFWAERGKTSKSQLSKSKSRVELSKSVTSVNKSKSRTNLSRSKSKVAVERSPSELEFLDYLRNSSISLLGIEKWFRDCDLLDTFTEISQTELTLVFKSMLGGSRYEMNWKEFKAFLLKVAEKTNLGQSEGVAKMIDILSGQALERHNKRHNIQ